ncbi:interferon-induced GTP-binding protein Mx1 [Thamnophis elegans]|uniref:interferon-induced GTP-binding protein Mx1 n=1 Tax=Thamnophis elegans TaxID=35005 RepID=UPI001378B1B0|nr:interferon-induced GTP-binding protein Mx1 [Thamnophis elegans]
MSQSGDSISEAYKSCEQKALAIVDFFRFGSKFRFPFTEKLNGRSQSCAADPVVFARTALGKRRLSPTLPAPSLKGHFFCCRDTAKSAMKKSRNTEYSPNKRFKKEAENNLCSHYEEKVRPCIDLIDSLRALGVEKDLALPAIAVIGDQSSGKSSVLEALSGVALPRGSGIVTRCPLELKMKKNNKNEEWKGKMVYLETEVELKDPSEVEDAVRRAQNAIAGEGLSISDKLISLEISSPNVPDLTLIDLPGITRVAVGNQPQDIGNQILKLIQSYITKQETINLVVVPSNVDIATTEALKMAQTVDPEGQRTLGILTKPDLIDEGTENETVDVVRNQRVPLKKGYMIVKCRGQSDLTSKLSLEDAIKKEREFFEEHKFFSLLLEEGKATIPFLAEKLTHELTEHIQRSLPTLEGQIETSLQKMHQKLQKYGDGVPESLEDKKYFFVEVKNYFAVNHTGIGNFEYISRGRELPGFVNFKTFENSIRWQIKQLEDPAIVVLKEVAELVRKAFIGLAIQHFSSFCALCKVAQNNIEDLKLTQEEKAKNTIYTQFKLENVVYCQDSVYSEDLRTVRETKITPVPYLADFTEKCSIEEMLYHMTAYYKSVKVRLGTQIPMIIQLYMFRDFAEKLQNAMMQLLQNGDQLEVLFHEGKDVVNIRNSLKERIQRLHKARLLLKKFFI